MTSGEVAAALGVFGAVVAGAFKLFAGALDRMTAANNRVADALTALAVEQQRTTTAVQSGAALKVEAIHEVKRELQEVERRLERLEPPPPAPKRRDK